MAKQQVTIHLGDGAPIPHKGKSKCPYCGGRVVVDLEACVTGFIHLVNCPIMLELRGEGTDEYRNVSLASLDWRDKHG
jgi:hypothetical protein